VTRQEAVVQALIDGFTSRTVEVTPTLNGTATVVVSDIQGHFKIDAQGNVVEWPTGASAELVYWIGIDLTSLDILRGGV